MTDNDQDRFGHLLAGLAETFREPMSPARIEGYWIALRDLTIQEVERAIHGALRTCTDYFPRPATLRQLGRPRYVPGAGPLIPETHMLPPPKRPALAAPEAMAGAIAGALSLVDQAIEKRTIEDAKATIQTQEQADARRVQLREQLKMVTEES